jgi:hypothetical protein
MRPFSMWWVFLFLFALLIAGIQSLGWWTRTASAQAPLVQRESPTSQRYEVCETMHWRSLVMQQ